MYMYIYVPTCTVHRVHTDAERAVVTDPDSAPGDPRPAMQRQTRGLCILYGAMRTAKSVEPNTRRILAFRGPSGPSLALVVIAQSTYQTVDEARCAFPTLEGNDSPSPWTMVMVSIAQTFVQCFPSLPLGFCISATVNILCPHMRARNMMVMSALYMMKHST